MDEGSDAAAVLVGMPEFVVRAASEEDGEVWGAGGDAAHSNRMPGVRDPGTVEGRRREADESGAARASNVVTMSFGPSKGATMPAQDSYPLGAPCWVDLTTSDTERSRAFYCELFGWTADEPVEEFGGYFNFRKDGVLVGGCMAAQPGTPDVWSIYLTTDDAEKTAETAAANGGLVVVPPMTVADLGTMAVLSDPGGAAVGLWQPGTHQGMGTIGEPGTPSWFELHTRDYQRSVDFYRAVFGWETRTMSDTE